MRFLVSLLAALAFVTAAVFVFRNLPQSPTAPVPAPTVTDKTPAPAPVPGGDVKPAVPDTPAGQTLPVITSLEVREFKDASGRPYSGVLVCVRADGRFYIQLETKKVWMLRYTAEADEQSLYARGALASMPELAKPLAVIPAAAEQAGYHLLSDKDGSVIIAKVVSLVQGQARIITSENKEFNVPFDRFCPEDQALIQKLTAPAPVEVAPEEPQEEGKTTQADPEVLKINELIGQELFADANLWDDHPKSAARRLKWPSESETNRDASFRSYPATSYKFLGTSPCSGALYGTMGKVTSVSLVYANKGDTFRSAGSAAEHFLNGGKADPKILKQLLKDDEEAIEKALTGLLGEPVRQLFGEGQSKRRVSRWDWKGHAFLLSAEAMEFVALAIEPVAVADARGKTQRTMDGELRKRLLANVENRPNGDVVIRNIPMVDQGPKGYCVPATFERVMRYCDIPADMYLLAMIGESGFGGGTSVKNMTENLTRDIRVKGRNVEELKGFKIDPSKIAKYVDDGIPILWTLHSTKLFNSLANSHTAERKNKSADEWKALARKYARDTAELKGSSENNHIVIIIGYNKETDEIAFSDSWGTSFNERWITASEAMHVSMGDFVVIRP